MFQRQRVTYGYRIKHVTNTITITSCIAKFNYIPENRSIELLQNIYIVISYSICMLYVSRKVLQIEKKSWYSTINAKSHEKRMKLYP